MNAVVFRAAATTAALVEGTDYALKDNGTTIRVLALTMKALRFLCWNTAANGQPGLELEVPDGDLFLMLLNIQAGAAGKGTAWVQT
jgi:hypothetical protein